MRNLERRCWLEGVPLRGADGAGDLSPGVGLWEPSSFAVVGWLDGSLRLEMSDMPDYLPQAVIGDGGGQCWG